MQVKAVLICFGIPCRIPHVLLAFPSGAQRQQSFSTNLCLLEGNLCENAVLERRGDGVC
jgi:hypothetical protein